MSASVFISDLHLDAPAGVEMLRHVLKQALTTQVEALYVLGDLFEAWIGDDDDNALTRATAELFNDYRQRGLRIYFMPGNRDFLLGQAYLDRFGGQLLADPTVIEIDDHRILLLHGDRQCLADEQYQTVRRQLRDPAWQQQFLARSLSDRRAFAADARKQSQAHTGSMQSVLMDADSDELERLLLEHRATLLIHGHTHRPAMHLLNLPSTSALRVVLGDWHDQPSWLYLDQAQLRLHARGLTLASIWP